MQENCGKCVDNKRSSVITRSSLLSGLLVIIIPKCPICVMAYTSAISMCGGPDMYMSHNNWVSYIPLFLSAGITGVILLNWKGTRSWFALFSALLGSLCVLLTHQLIVDPVFYTYGTILLFFGIWLNSNLLATIDYLRTVFNKLAVRWQR